MNHEDWIIYGIVVLVLAGLWFIVWLGSRDADDDTIDPNNEGF